VGKKIYHTMNDVPIGTEMIYKYDGRRCKLTEITHFERRFLHCTILHFTFINKAFFES